MYLDVVFPSRMTVYLDVVFETLKDDSMYLDVVFPSRMTVCTWMLCFPQG